MIEVYTANTPNGVKVTIAMEELGQPYTLHRVKLSENEQKSPAFLQINPNGRIPAIVDTEGPEGAPLPVFESGAILLYLAEKFGGLLPKTPVRRIEAIEWTFFQAAGIGPMFGQSGVFRRREEPIEFALTRYRDESQRLTEVLESRLKDNAFLAGPELSIADIAHFGWIDNGEKYAGIDLAALPAVRRWRDAMRARPAFQRGLDVLR